MCSVTCSCSKTGLGLIFRSFTTMAGVPFLHSKKVRRATVLSPMLSPLGANKFPNAMGLERSLPGVIEGRDVRFWHKADIVKPHNAPTATCGWMSGPRATQGMRPLLAHEARPCSIYGEAVLEVHWRLVACLYDLRRPVAACGCGSLYATNSHAPSLHPPQHRITGGFALAPQPSTWGDVSLGRSTPRIRTNPVQRRKN